MTLSLSLGGSDALEGVFGNERKTAVRCSPAGGQAHVRALQAFAGKTVGIKEVHEDVWLMSFMDYDLGYFDLETRVIEPLENPLGPKSVNYVLVPFCYHVSGLDH